MSFQTVRGVLSAAVASAGTFTVSYPTGFSRGDFAYGVRHRLVALSKVFVAPDDMTLSFGASSVTVTYNGATTLPLGSAFTFQFDSPGASDLTDATSAVPIATLTETALVKLGSPTALSTTGVCASQAVAAAGNLTLAAGVSTTGLGARTGRNITAVSANAGDTTQVLTVYGTDMYGKAMSEAITLNGTTAVAGAKAFFKVSRVAASALTAGNVSVGRGNVLGLPVYLPNAVFILKEATDNAAPTAGTTVAGLSIGTKSTTTTADVRGTYLPNQATDGSKDYTLVVALADPTFLGSTQA